jgi:NAD(P)-dependent dehydrogenase (short-subunit alcohol dehydrogenase family)
VEAKVTLITGCSSGFGRAAALEFRKAGWKVAATMRDVSKWPAADFSENLLVLPLDVQHPASVQGAITQTIEHFGEFDCVVNDAGGGLFSVFETTPMQAVRALFETNVFGLMQVTQAVLPHFRNNGGGRVINVRSGSGIVPEPLMSVYGATKHAVEGFTESLAYELATQNITVKLIEPDFVKGTNFIQQTVQASQAASVPPSYQAFVDQITAMYMDDSPFELGTEVDVAGAIVAAASHHSDTLRYVVGAGTGVSARMRRETSEAEYRAWAHGKFAAKPATAWQR